MVLIHCLWNRIYDYLVRIQNFTNDLQNNTVPNKIKGSIIVDIFYVYVKTYLTCKYFIGIFFKNFEMKIIVLISRLTEL